MERQNKYQKSIDRLNEAIGKEIATTLQYLYFHVHFEDDGFEFLAKMMKQTAMTEMFHIDRIADRILFLEGDVEMTPSFEVRKITDATEALQFAATLEERTARSYNEFSRLCSAEDDAPTHRLFLDMAVEEEKHLDLFRTELQHLLDYGDSYLALQAAAHAETIAQKERK